MEYTLKGDGPLVASVLFAELGLAAVVIALRGYTRHFIKGGLAPDDYALWVTWTLQLLFVIMMLFSCLHGFGQHNADLSKYHVMMATKFELLAQFFISLSMGTSKSAVGLLLLRILNTKWHKWILWFWIFTMNFLVIMLAISVYAQCDPVESLWDTDIAVEACPINLTQVAFVTCSWSAAMDFFLALFPWYVIWTLNMKTKDKITVCVSLSLGVIAGVCGIIRTTGLEVISNSADYLQATADSIMWTSSEQTITILCVSLPSLRPLWQRIRGIGSTNDYPSGAVSSRSRTYGARKISTNVDAADNDHDGGNFSMQNLQHQTQISGQGGTTWQEADDNSDKSILGAGIMRKQEVSVTFGVAK